MTGRAGRQAPARGSRAPDQPYASLPRLLLLFVILVVTWLLWSGVLTPLLLVLGLGSCLLTCWLAQRMGYFDNQLFALLFSARLLGYLVWLSGEVVRSSLEVARVVLDPRLPISPRLVDIGVEAVNPVDQVIFGNSVTLTPGTLALDLHDGVLKVHSLTRRGAQALVSGEMNRRVAALREG